MASKIEFVEFMADQLREAGTITYKKMLSLIHISEPTRPY